MLKAADRSSKISTEDLEVALASLRASTTEQGSLGRVSTSETRLVAVQEVVLCEKDRDLVEHNSFKSFCFYPVCRFFSRRSAMKRPVQSDLS